MYVYVYMSYIDLCPFHCHTLLWWLCSFPPLLPKHTSTTTMRTMMSFFCDSRWRRTRCPSSKNIIQWPNSHNQGCYHASFFSFLVNVQAPQCCGEPFDLALQRVVSANACKVSFFLPVLALQRAILRPYFFAFGLCKRLHSERTQMPNCWDVLVHSRRFLFLITPNPPVCTCFLRIIDGAVCGARRCPAVPSLMPSISMRRDTKQIYDRYDSWLDGILHAG